MKTCSWLFGLPVLALCAFVLPLSGCNENKPDYQTQPPTPPAAKPRMTGDVKPANPGKVVEGSALNKMFPPNEADFKVTYTQEKKGFAQAEVTQGGKKMASLSISDTLAHPSAKTKFASSSAQIAGFPSANVGSQGTAVLVGNRFQIQVRSENPAFGAGLRQAWIAKFNTNALKQLAGE